MSQPPLESTLYSSAIQSARARAALALIKRFLRHRSAMVGVTILLILIILAIAAPAIAPFDPLKQNLRQGLAPPSAEHPLGTDEFGRDILSRILYGARISLRVGVMVVLLSGTIGVLLGMVAGYYEGRIDTIISRAVDILLAFPSLLLAIAVITILGPSLINALFAIAIAQVPRYARVTRGVTLSQKQRDYVDAARALGGSPPRIMFIHLLPNVIGPVVVLASLGVATAILTTASLSFLGLGAQPPEPEWGAMLSTGRSYMRQAWWITLFPGLAIMITVLAINLFGDGLRDVLDPKT